MSQVTLRLPETLHYQLETLAKPEIITRLQQKIAAQ